MIGWTSFHSFDPFRHEAIAVVREIKEKKKRKGKKAKLEADDEEEGDDCTKEDLFGSDDDYEEDGFVTKDPVSKKDQRSIETMYQTKYKEFEQGDARMVVESFSLSTERKQKALLAEDAMPDLEPATPSTDSTLVIAAAEDELEDDFEFVPRKKAAPDSESEADETNCKEIPDNEEEEAGSTTSSNSDDYVFGEFTTPDEHSLDAEETDELPAHFLVKDRLVRHLTSPFWAFQCMFSRIKPGVYQIVQILDARRMTEKLTLAGLKKMCEETNYFKGHEQAVVHLIHREVKPKKVNMTTPLTEENMRYFRSQNAGRLLRNMFKTVDFFRALSAFETGTFETAPPLIHVESIGSLLPLREFEEICFSYPPRMVFWEQMRTRIVTETMEIIRAANCKHALLENERRYGSVLFSQHRPTWTPGMCEILKRQPDLVFFESYKPFIMTTKTIAEQDEFARLAFEFAGVQTVTVEIDDNDAYLKFLLDQHSDYVKECLLMTNSIDKRLKEMNAEGETMHKKMVSLPKGSPARKSMFKEISDMKKDFDAVALKKPAPAGRCYIISSNSHRKAVYTNEFQFVDAELFSTASFREARFVVIERAHMLSLPRFIVILQKLLAVGVVQRLYICGSKYVPCEGKGQPFRDLIASGHFQPVDLDLVKTVPRIWKEKVFSFVDNMASIPANEIKHSVIVCAHERKPQLRRIYPLLAKSQILSQEQVSVSMKPSRIMVLVLENIRPNCILTIASVWPQRTETSRVYVVGDELDFEDICQKGASLRGKGSKLVEAINKAAH